MAMTAAERKRKQRERQSRFGPDAVESVSLTKDAANVLRITASSLDCTLSEAVGALGKLEIAEMLLRWRKQDARNLPEELQDYTGLLFSALNLYYEERAVVARALKELEESQALLKTYKPEEL